MGTRPPICELEIATRITSSFATFVAESARGNISVFALHPLMQRQGTYSFLLCFILTASAIAQTDTWLEVRTPHFVIVSNSSEKEARQAALQFEKMRSVLRNVFPEAAVDAATPITVLAVADKRTLESLKPEAYIGKGKLNLAGLFLLAPEKNYVLLWLNMPGLHSFAGIYHEYTHFVVSRTGEWLPLWLNEGSAEFYQNTEIDNTEVRLGKADAAVLALLQRSQLLPLATILTVDQHSPYYQEEDKGSMFYAESWALTHYLKAKDTRENTHRIRDYLDLMHENVDSVNAAAQAFGDLQQLQADLQKYIVNADYVIQHLPGSTDVDESSFSTQALTQSQSDGVRADFLAYAQRVGDARKLLDDLLREDPANASAHESLGYIAFRSGNFTEAQKQYEQALKLNAQSVLANYYFAAVTLKVGLPDAATQARVENSLRTAMRLNPSFGLAYYGMGVLTAARGKNHDEAYQWMLKALQLDPANVEIRIASASVLMRLNRDKEAMEVLELALKFAHTSEQTAAVEKVMQSVRQFQAMRQKQHGPTVRFAGPSSKAGNQAQTPPRPVYMPEPEYTEEGRQARREGVCILSLVVGVDGKPSNIVVTRKLGYGLDEKAVEAVRKWKFEPARSYGRPVMARMNLSMKFSTVGGDNDGFIELSQKAGQGDAAAEFELAKAFLEGRGIPKDENRGMVLLERAARNGLSQAQFQMGERIYGDGNDSARYVEAYLWYSLAQKGAVEQSDSRVADVEARMTAEQLAEARKRLDNWSGK